MLLRTSHTSKRGWFRKTSAIKEGKGLSISTMRLQPELTCSAPSHQTTKESHLAGDTNQLALVFSPDSRLAEPRDAFRAKAKLFQPRCLRSSPHRLGAQQVSRHERNKHTSDARNRKTAHKASKLLLRVPPKHRRPLGC